MVSWEWVSLGSPGCRPGSACHCLPGAGSKGVHRHAWLGPPFKLCFSSPNNHFISLALYTAFSASSWTFSCIIRSLCTAIPRPVTQPILRVTTGIRLLFVWVLHFFFFSVLAEQNPSRMQLKSARGKRTTKMTSLILILFLQTSRNASGPLCITLPSPLSPAPQGQLWLFLSSLRGAEQRNQKTHRTPAVFHILIITTTWTETSPACPPSGKVMRLLPGIETKNK